MKCVHDYIDLLSTTDFDRCGKMLRNEILFVIMKNVFKGPFPQVHHYTHMVDL